MKRSRRGGTEAQESARGLAIRTLARQLAEKRVDLQAIQAAAKALKLADVETGHGADLNLFAAHLADYLLDPATTVKQRYAAHSAVQAMVAGQYSPEVKRRLETALLESFERHFTAVILELETLHEGGLIPSTVVERTCLFVSQILGWAVLRPAFERSFETVGRVLALLLTQASAPSTVDEGAVVPTGGRLTHPPSLVLKLVHAFCEQKFAGAAASTLYATAEQTCAVLCDSARAHPQAQLLAGLAWARVASVRDTSRDLGAMAEQLAADATRLGALARLKGLLAELDASQLKEERLDQIVSWLITQERVHVLNFARNVYYSALVQSYQLLVARAPANGRLADRTDEIVALVRRNWEDPVDGASFKLQELYRLAIRARQRIHGDNLEGAFAQLVGPVLGLGQGERLRYQLLGLLVEAFPPRLILAQRPDFVSALLDGFQNRNLCAVAGTVLRRFVGRALADQSAEKAAILRAAWLDPIVAVFCDAAENPASSDLFAAQLREFCLPKLFVADPAGLPALYARIQKAVPQPEQQLALLLTLVKLRFHLFPGAAAGAPVEGPDGKLGAAASGALVREAAVALDDSVRMDAVRLQCDLLAVLKAANAAEDPLAHDLSGKLDALHDAILGNMACGSTELRHDLTGALGKFFSRVAVQIYALNRANLRPAASSESQLALNAYQKFLARLGSSLAAALRPGAAFPRQAAALALLESATAALGWNHVPPPPPRPDAPQVAPVSFGTSLDDPAVAATLLDNVLDGRYDANRQRCAALLVAFPGALPRPDEELVELGLQRAAHVCAADADGGALLVRVLWQRGARGADPATFYALLESLLNGGGELKETRILSLCLALEQLLVETFKQSDSNFRGVPAEIMDTMQQLCARVLERVGHECPEARHDNDDDGALHVAFRTVAAAAGIIAALFRGSAPLPDFATSQRAGVLLQDLLLRVRHRGTFQAVERALGHVARRLLESSETHLNHGQLPKSWLEDALATALDPATAVGYTRRSAGLPFLVAAIVRSEPSGTERVLLAAAMRRLLAPHDGLPAIHSLNVLRALFSDSDLAPHVSAYLVDALERTILAFSHPTFCVRNAAMVLYTDLLARALGADAINQGSTSRTLTVRELFQRYPQLETLLVAQLDAALAGAQPMDAPRPQLYPILVLLARLKPAGASEGSPRANVARLCASVRACAASRDARLRAMSARALAPLVAAGETVRTSLGILHEAATAVSLSSNRLHGDLLHAHALVRRFSENGLLAVASAAIKLVVARGTCDIHVAAALDLARDAGQSEDSVVYAMECWAAPNASHLVRVAAFRLLAAERIAMDLLPRGVSMADGTAALASGFYEICELWPKKEWDPAALSEWLARGPKAAAQKLPPPARAAVLRAAAESTAGADVSDGVLRAWAATACVATAPPLLRLAVKSRNVGWDTLIGLLERFAAPGELVDHRLAAAAVAGELSDKLDAGAQRLRHARVLLELLQDDARPVRLAAAAGMGVQKAPFYALAHWYERLGDLGDSSSVFALLVGRMFNARVGFCGRELAREFAAAVDTAVAAARDEAPQELFLCEEPNLFREPLLDAQFAALALVRLVGKSSDALVVVRSELEAIVEATHAALAAAAARLSSLGDSACTDPTSHPALFDVAYRSIMALAVCRLLLQDSRHNVEWESLPCHALLRSLIRAGRESASAVEFLAQEWLWDASGLPFRVLFLLPTGQCVPSPLG